MLAEHVPYFSVVVPCYNRSQEIRRTLASVLDQTFQDFECIVVDDGSDDSDELAAVVRSFEDPRFRYIHRTNGGGGAARNTGIDAARGLYVAFLDSDDIFIPHKLSCVKDYIEKRGVQAVYSKALVDRGVSKYWVRPDRGIAPNEDMGEYLFLSNQFIQTSTIVMSMSAARSVMFDPDLRKGQDLDFCVRAHARGIRFAMIDEPLTIWTDVSEFGRTSRHAGSEAPQQWLAAHRAIMTERAVRGYRATVLAYYQPKWKFVIVLRDLFLGVLAGVPLKTAARHWLRFMLPRKAYRWLVDGFVKIGV